ncbi:MAG: helix-turn-helix transcriptional regulator [Methanobacteriota archaeon]
MDAGEVEAGALDSGFSSSKKHILLFLKRGGEASLTTISTEVGVSKMAALRHLVALEGRGLVQRSQRPEGRGRPRVYFRLADTAASLFPQAYAHMTTKALEFIEERLGREAVVRLLKERSREVYDRHKARFGDGELREKVAVLARLRDEEGYMAELGAATRTTFELLEHNCPIVAIAGRYGEACEVERRLFENLLRADVDTTHRVVAGAPVCRFLIRRHEPRRSTG